MYCSIAFNLLLLVESKRSNTTFFLFSTGNATSLKEDVHVPAVNMSDQKETEKVLQS